MKTNTALSLALCSLLSVNYAVAQTPPPAVTNGLAAYYPFNGNANDACGGGYDGIVSWAELAADRYDTPSAAYWFNGINSCIRFFSIPLSQVDNWTISAWINPASISQVGTVVAMGYDNGQTGDGFSYGLASGELSGCVTTAGCMSGGHYSFSSNRWHQVVVLREAGTMKLFVNGDQVSGSYSGGMPTATPKIPTDFRIGSSSGFRFFKGLVDDVRIYSRALTAGEVMELYNFEAPDTDQDGLRDYEETTIYHTDPLKVDTDGDGLSDKAEVTLYHTDPLKTDTDGDGFADSTELKNGHDPLNASDYPLARIYESTAIELEFFTQTNKTYMVQASLDSVTWTNFDGPIVGDGKVWRKLYDVSPKANLRFRVELAP